MPTSIVTIANQKGGVGKTTTVVNLAASYAQMNKRVLVVDMDYQSNSSELLGVAEQAQQSGRDLATGILHELTLDKLRLPSNTEGIDVLAATRELDDVREKMQGQPLQHLMLNMILDCPALEEYDLVLIDTHPSLDCLLLSALVASHYYLVPMFAEKTSSKGLAHMVSWTQRMRRLNPMLLFLGVVITRYDRTVATHVKFEKLIREAGKAANFHVFQTLIPSSASVPGSDAANQVLLTYKRTAPVTIAYSALAGEALPYLKGKRTGRVPTLNVEVLQEVAEEFEVMPEINYDDVPN
jgi:chromosome partitioning protein